jgi:uncharacterized protein YeaO (DUF488 family)
VKSLSNLPHGYIIKTKSVYDSAEPSDGIRVLVTRFHPRKKGFKKGIGYDIWLKALSPPKELLKAYRKREITQDKFREMYLKHLHANEGKEDDKGSDRETEVSRALQEVRNFFLHRGGEKHNNAIITLLCYEPEDGKTFCHRHVLKDYLFGRKV